MTTDTDFRDQAVQCLMRVMGYALFDACRDVLMLTDREVDDVLLECRHARDPQQLAAAAVATAAILFRVRRRALGHRQAVELSKRDARQLDVVLDAAAPPAQGGRRSAVTDPPPRQPAGRMPVKLGIVEPS